MPFISASSWRHTQANDKVHTQVKHLIDNGLKPEKKKTRGPNTKTKLLYNQVIKGDARYEDGLLKVKHTHKGEDFWAIYVPFQIFPGLAMAVHVNLKHPSKHQMLQVMNRYFY